ncbi:MAG: hypothetical protein PHX78_12030 [bacterium]|nr:hypothetical protein [bacterium]
MIKRIFKNNILICPVVFIFPLLILMPVFADCPPRQNNTDFTLFNSSPIATARCVAVKDDMVFIGAGGSILVYDTRNISVPEKIAEVKTFGIIMQMAVADNFLYVAAGCEGMYIFDIQDRGFLKCIRHLSFDRFCSSIFLYKDLIFLGQEGSLKVFKNKDYDPGNISFIREINIKGQFNKEVSTIGQVEGILIEGDKLFAVCAMGGLYIFNLKDNFRELKHISFPHKTAFALAYSREFIYFNFENMIYGLDTKSLIYKKIHTFSRPENGRVYHMIVKGDYIYIFFDDSIHLFQIKAPFVFRYIIKYILPGDHVRRGVMYNNFLFAADEDKGIIIFDMETPEKLIMKSRIETPGEIVGLAMDKDNLFVCDYNGLNIYNIQDPLRLKSSNKTFIKYPDVSHAVIQEKRIFIGRTISTNKNSFVDICELPDFKKMRTLKFTGELLDMQIHNNQLFVATAGNFYIYDIRLTQHPKRIFSFRIPGFPDNINFYKDMLLITQFGEGYSELPTLSMKLDENGNVVKPFTVSSLLHNPLGENVRSILHSDCVNKIIECDSYTYIVRYYKLYIFSKMDNTLRFVHAVTLPDQIRDIAIQQFQDVAYVYLAAEDAGLYVLKHRIRRFSPKH